MRQTVSGDIVRFVVGAEEDSTVCEFPMPENMTSDGSLKHFHYFDDRDPPPTYCELLVSTQTLPIDNNCGSGNAVTDPVAPAPGNRFDV